MTMSAGLLLKCRREGPLPLWTDVSHPQGSEWPFDWEQAELYPQTLPSQFLHSSQILPLLQIKSHMKLWFVLTWSNLLLLSLYNHRGRGWFFLARFCLKKKSFNSVQTTSGVFSLNVNINHYKW
jgi:hypothetical protein